MKSFAILRTNVGLTTNVKIIVDSNYNLSLDSINTNYTLFSHRFKKYRFNSENYYDEILPKFFKNVPPEISYDIKYHEDVDTMYNTFISQYEDLYTGGARNIIENKNYDEEYEYLSPLYLGSELPSNFIIFRIDGSGITNTNKEIFKEEILNKFKTVKVFDLGPTTPIGKWLRMNFTENEYFPHAPLEIDFRTVEFSKWNGIDYIRGGYVSKSLFLDEVFERENEIYTLEKFIFNNYKELKVVFPNILNLTFLFDDTPANPEIKRKWSLNRYFGFYINEMEAHKTLSPYQPPKLKEDVKILENNILYSETSPTNPFIENWSEDKPFYVEIYGNYYLVKKFTEKKGEEILQYQDVGFINEEYQNVNFTYFKIISDEDLTGLESDINKNYGYIDSSGIIKKSDVEYFDIEEFDSADIWLILIDGIYHNIVKTENDNFILNTDYSFNFKKNYFEYKVQSKITSVSFLVDFDNPPKKFDIFKINFTEIKDFDTRIVDTQYSRYEYEKSDSLTNTDEPKLYFENIKSKNEPKDINEYEFADSIVNIPVSSEYTANYETFKIEEDGTLSDIWRTNSVYCRFGFQGSNSFADWPYMLNNSLLLEDFNQCANVFESKVIRKERNLDYFYSVNSSTHSYTHHSLHIESLDSNGSLDVDFVFDIQKYLNIFYEWDYFDYFFKRPHYFEVGKIKKNVKKYSLFNKGDSTIPNNTLFKGLEFKIYSVSNVSLDENGLLEGINVTGLNEFQDYKFSILISEVPNRMVWEIIPNWELEVEYKQDDIVVFDDILYKAKVDNTEFNPSEQIGELSIKSAPYLYNTTWEYYENDILWSPNSTYNLLDINSNTPPSVVYNNGVYYSYYDEGGDDFWNPDLINSGGYDIEDIVLYRGKYYKSMTSSNIIPPGLDLDKNKFSPIGENYKWWAPTNEQSPMWKEIEVWNPGKEYFNSGNMVVHNEIVWMSNNPDGYIDIGEEPGFSTLWIRIYSLAPDSSIIYKPDYNPIIWLNGRYYLIKSNNGNEKLSNGIDIYINKKWKNILINIYYGDSTLPNISNSDRDNLYSEIYSNITAYNFIRAINDMSNKYGFQNYLKYIVIEEDLTVNEYSYDNNIQNLPCIISCETPQGLIVKENSLIKSYIDVKNLNLNIKLTDNKIDKMSKLNWYNGGPIAYTISKNLDEPKVFKNYNSNKNIDYLQIYRFNGYYMPIFIDIELFNWDSLDKKSGNYLFDTNLTNFGLNLERKFRKVNRKRSILKFNNSKTEKSIYPMVDEYGYSYTDFFIFKSTWDPEYFLETVDNKDRLIVKKSIFIKVDKSIGQSSDNKLNDDKNYKL